MEISVISSICIFLTIIIWIIKDHKCFLELIKQQWILLKKEGKRFKIYVKKLEFWFVQSYRLLTYLYRCSGFVIDLLLKIFLIIFLRNICVLAGADNDSVEIGICLVYTIIMFRFAIPVIFQMQKSVFSLLISIMRLGIEISVCINMLNKPFSQTTITNLFRFFSVSIMFYILLKIVLFVMGNKLLKYIVFSYKDIDPKIYINDKLKEFLILEKVVVTYSLHGTSVHVVEEEAQIRFIYSGMYLKVSKLKNIEGAALLN